MDKTLKGKSGKTIFEQSQDGRPIPNARQETINPVPGREVQLTIDSDLQWFAQNAVAQKVIETQALSGTVVVENVKTGELLAVASYPTFDPNQPGQSSENWTNKAFSDVYEPGSTGKVMTAAAAIEEGVVTPSTVVEVPNRIRRADNKEFKDSHDHPTEYLTFAGVLAQSSNIGTILAGEKVKASTMYDYFTKFGLGQTSGMGFPGEGPGLLTNVKDWSGSQRYTVLFGQGLSVNALQAAGVFQTIANDGVRIPPRIVAATGDGKGGFTPAAKPAPVKVVSPETAKQVRDMLEGVVGKEGTAPEAKIAGYRVAGKTGTADRYDARVGGYSGKTASFIGFAPADDPEIVVAVTLQRPIKGYFGGAVAGPVFHDVMTYALQELQIPPDRHVLPGREDPRREDSRRQRHQRAPRPQVGRIRRLPLTVGSLSVSSPRPSSPHATSLDAVAALVGGERVGADRAVTGVTLASQDVVAGDLYAALPGANAHGARYAAGAREAGAVAVLTDAEGAAALDADGRRPAARRGRGPPRARGRGGLAGLRDGRPPAADVRRDRDERQDHHGLPGQLGADRARPHDRADRHGRDPDRRRADQERRAPRPRPPSCTPCSR